MDEIKPAEVVKLVEKDSEIAIIDVREDEEVAEGKIPRAKHIPLGQLAERMDEIDPNKEHIMVCRSGGRSGRACELLKAHGYKVRNMDGGMLEWKGELEK